MNKRIHILLPFLLLLNSVFAQITPFKHLTKYGYNKDGVEFIRPIYDTVLPFDKANNVCMACVKTQKPSSNKFIKMNNTVLLCKYLNSDKKELIIKIKSDTCSYFTFQKTSYEGYAKYDNYIIVHARDNKYVVDKNFNQITFTGHDDVVPLELKGYFKIENKTTGASYLDGVIDDKEKTIVPTLYSSIHLNKYDTLFSACTAQIKAFGNDDVYDVRGSKLNSLNRHIENATRNFIIHKIYEPSEYYIILNINTKKETIIHAESITYLGGEIARIVIRGKSYDCNMLELDTYKFLNHD